MKAQHLRTAIAVSLLATSLTAQPSSWQWPVADWAAVSLERAKIQLTPTPGAVYVVATRLNPMVLSGDFNGDHLTDFAVLVRHTKNGKIGIAVALQDAGVEVIGAGRAFGNGGDDFTWLDHWYTYTKAPVERGADQAPPPQLIGDALFVEKSESASALIYFTPSGYRWYQQGD
jgi:hypothetical protein